MLRDRGTSLKTSTELEIVQDMKEKFLPPSPLLSIPPPSLPPSLPPIPPSLLSLPPSLLSLPPSLPSSLPPIPPSLLSLPSSLPLLSLPPSFLPTSYPSLPPSLLSLPLSYFSMIFKTMANFKTNLILSSPLLFLLLLPKQRSQLTPSVRYLHDVPSQSPLLEFTTQTLSWTRFSRRYFRIANSRLQTSDL